MATTIIGIDPGAKGAIAVWHGDAMTNYRLEKLTEYDTRNVLAGFCDDSLAYLEQVGGGQTAKDGGQKFGSQGMFKFGLGYGFIRGLLVGLKIPFEDVRPIVWQRGMGIPSVKGETTPEKKRRHKAKAQQLWPELHVVQDNCDALLIAEYGRRQTNRD